MLKDVKEIEYLIRARYPQIFIRTTEEVRVEDAIKKIGEDRNKRVFFWSVTNGLEEPNNPTNGELREPIRILDYIIDAKVNGIFVLRDFHPYLNDPVVVRKLRDANRVLKTCLKNIIFLSPSMNIPVELEKELNIVDFSLPDKNEINQIIDSVLRSIENPKNIEVFTDAKKKNKIVEAALGLTAEEAENVFAKSLVQTGQFDIDIVLMEKEQIIKKSGVLEYYKSDDNMQNVGGLENLKGWLKKRSKAFTPKAREFGLPEPKGILMIGIPGCGKSLTAKAISSMWKLPLLRLDVGKVFSSLVGSSEENVRKAIATAESIAPSILWLDELEKGFSGMGGGGDSDGGTSARVFGTFLTWLQDKKSPVFVVATSNDISQLPPELLRKGRFDEIFYIDLPNSEERETIFKIHLGKRNRNPELFNIKRLAEISSGYSGSEIEEIVVSALYDAFDEDVDIDMKLLEKSVANMIPLSQTMEEKINQTREWASVRARNAATKSFADEIKDEGRKIEMDLGVLNG